MAPRVRHAADSIGRGRRAARVEARGNSLRALAKYLDNVSDDDIVEVNTPTGQPPIYELDEDLRPIRTYYLGDAETIHAAMEAVAKQGKAAPSDRVKAE